MIHTAAMYFFLEEGNINTINKTKTIYHKMNHTDFGYDADNSIKLTIVSRKIDLSVYEDIDGETILFYENKMWIAFLTIDFIELLNEKTDITESDIPEIKRKIESFLTRILGSISSDLILTRIDYRFDVVIEDKRTRELLIKLYKKCVNKKFFMLKSTKYKTSICYNSGSRRNNIYDKLAEREANKIAPKDYETNVMRYEAQLLKRHVKYNEKKAGIERMLENYISKEMYNKYMKKMIVDVFYPGDYWSINKAREIIQASSIKDKDKEGLIGILKNTSKQGISGSKALLTEHYYKKYLKLLEELNINPILIPKHENIHFLRNPMETLIENIQD